MSYRQLEVRLGYRFRNPSLLEQALRHRSWVNEQPDGRLQDNEKLEFLGDAVVDLAVGHLLMQRHPHYSEGDLSRIRAALVNEASLADLARDLGLGDYLLLGKGEQATGGSEKPSILADALEAVIAAVYLDGGFDRAFDLVRRLFAGPVADAPAPGADGDYKSRLQEETQHRQGATPRYAIIAENGPDHDKTFVAQVTAGSIRATGTGKSKKAAEQQAARKALGLLVGLDETAGDQTD